MSIKTIAAKAFLLAALAPATTLILSCTRSDRAVPVPADWIIVTAGDAFRFRAPADVRAVPVQGIDSFVGEYQGDGLVIQFDYGPYSSALGEMEAEGASIDWIRVDDRRAKLATQPGHVAIHFPEVEGDTKLSVFVTTEDPNAMQQADIMLRSIQFGDKLNQSQ